MTGADTVTARLAPGRNVDASTFTDLTTTSRAQVVATTLTPDGLQVTFDRPLADGEAAAVSRRIRSVDAADEAERTKADMFAAGNFVTPQDFLTGSTDPQPRMRLNRSDPLGLDATWRRVDFNGTSARNVNTFPAMDTGPRKVTWGATSRLLRFMDTVDRNYDLQLSTKLTAASLLAVANLATIKAQLRFVVPAPTPTYFPLPDDTEPGVDLCPVNLTGVSRDVFNITIYANASIRQYGLGVELRLSAAVANVQLLAADLIVYGR